MRNFLTLALIGLLSAGCSPSGHPNAVPSPIVDAPKLAGAVTEGANNGKTSSLSTSTVLTMNPTATSVSPTSPNIASITPVPTAASYVDLAKQDLAARLKIASAQITLVHATEIAAADLYAGCSRKAGLNLMPDQSGNGYQILLAAQGQNYLYHVGIDDRVILCENMNTGTTKP